jgi:manganese/zinc/iron transport system permease protein
MTSTLFYSNPYTQTEFFTFFQVLFQRLWMFFNGEISSLDIANDEVQILVLLMISISSAIIGTYLILRRMTMLANALSHTILVGIVLAYFLLQQSSSGVSEHLDLNLSSMMLAALLMGVLTTFFTEFLTKTVRLPEDASIGIVFTSLFAIGIILVTVLTKNAHLGSEVVMGHVDALQLNDLKLVSCILALNLVCVCLFFKEYLITTFDPALARSLGVSVVCFNYLLMIQASATVIGAFRAVGVLMVLALITGPVLAARLLTHKLKYLIILASAIGGFASVIGVALSRHILTAWNLPLSTGGVVVCVILIIYFLISLGRGVLLHWQIKKECKQEHGTGTGSSD